MSLCHSLLACHVKVTCHSLLRTKRGIRCTTLTALQMPANLGTALEVFGALMMFDVLVAGHAEQYDLLSCA